MLYLTYLRFELRHRLRQAVFIAAGLAVGVGLVITVSAASTGVKNAQARVLDGLYGIGTDITVTRPYTRGDTEPGHAVPPPGQQFEYLDDANQGLFSASAAASIAALAQVRAAVGMLALDETNPSAYSGPFNPEKGLPVTILVDGVDTADQALGPISQARVISGRDLTAADADADVALANSGYARAHRLHAGSVITLAHVSFRVIGIVSQPPGTVPAILIPIRAGQRVSRLGNRMTTVYVAAASAADVGTVAGEISALLPWADVTTSASLASEISGSLATTAKLATDLGRWIAAAALAAAFALAAILTVASVSRRVREFGTLKALGWRARRITAQVLGESAVTGLAGALAASRSGSARRR